jgi:hypothetical protein
MPSDDAPKTQKRKRTRPRKRANGEHNLPRAGLIALALIFGLGFLAIQAPEWNTSKQTEYVCSTSIGSGVGGIIPGSYVLVGGIEYGQITAVNTVLDPITHDPIEIEIHFDLDSSIPVRMDAIIRKYVGVSGTNGTLNFADLGTPTHSFEPGDRRDIPLSAAASGVEALLGVRASSHALQTQYLVELFSANIQNAVERSKNQILGFQAAVENLQHRIPSDVDGWEGVVNGLIAKSPEWSMRLQKIAQAFSDIQLAFDPIATFMNWLKTEASRRLARSVNEVEISRHNLMKAKEHVDDLESQITSLTRGAQQSISLAEKTIAQIQTLVPEVRDSIQRTLARSSLAGGQLSRLQSSFLSTGLDAIFHSPNDASWSRRQLLESVEDTLLAITSLQQASLALESFASTHAEALKSSPRLAELLTEPIDEKVRELNHRLRALYEYVVRNAP